MSAAEVRKHSTKDNAANTGNCSIPDVHIVHVDDECTTTAVGGLAGHSFTLSSLDSSTQPQPSADDVLPPWHHLPTRSSFT